MIRILLLLLVLTSCVYKQKETTYLLKGKIYSLKLNIHQAQRFSKLPLKCLQNEYPNKLNQVINGPDELQGPKELHPAFYGCFDWHSAVHGHWLLIRLLKEYPGLRNREHIRSKLNHQLTQENILAELAYFKRENNENFERTYGWAWILKLQEELLTWDDPDAKLWAENLAPLAQYVVQKYETYLPKLLYPIRSGEHFNSAFGLSLAFDYAKTTKNSSLRKMIELQARKFYLTDKTAPIRFEPSGYDFLSPILEEADLMRRVLSKKDFVNWFETYLPQIMSSNFSLAVGKVSDRKDGKLVHLDGLNFSRAWCLYGISKVDKRYSHLRKIADEHLAYSLPFVVDGNYMGEHWLASFALYALLERQQTKRAV
jgi:hypothetical protein